ncbi:hypothetical protein SAMN06295960_1200 [Paenibacillus aquistagni]|uniref:Uncharacterized protein n=1 Tax=Paenibacillus aquistagni TaxID=1852522 RepID=A0A1X7J5I1_9BACL|nr:hypothetical protein SAMN06295960_1200 [Paenibacillus aquistagni]
MAQDGFDWKHPLCYKWIEQPNPFNSEEEIKIHESILVSRELFSNDHQSI